MVHPNETSAGEGLTFFGAPKEDNDENSSSVLQFVVNLFSSKKGGQKPSDDVASSSSDQSISSSDQSSKQSSRKKTQKVISPRVSGSEVEIKLRSFSSLFKELPRFMKGPQSVEDPTDGIEDSSSSSSNFKGTELRQYWMPDEQCHECYECGEKFTTFRRRHHCRICGQIFCSRCCNQLISGKIMGVPGMLRSCIYCCKLVLMFAEGDTPQSVINSTFSAINGHNNDSSMEDAIPDSSSIMNESMLSFGSNHLGHGTSQNVKQSQSNTSLMRAMQTTPNYGHESMDDQLFGPRSYDPVNTLSVMSPAKDARAWHQPGFLFDTTPDVPPMSVLGDDVTEDLVKDSTQLHSLWRKINDERQGIEFRDHRLRLRKYSNCITGQELIDWLIKNDWASTRTQGCAIGQALYEGKWLKPVVDIGGVFQDGYVLFQSGRRPSKSAGTNRIEIFPDHFANFPTEVDGADTLQMMTDREPVWVQEIKCEEENDEEKVDGSYDNESETELTWSDAPNTFNEALLYSDEERSTSEKSVVSLSSFVEIDEGNDVIKYKRPNSMDDMSSVISQRNVLPVQPMYDDSSLMSISADYLRSFITWNGNYLNQRWISPSSGWRESDLQSSYLDSHDKRAFHWLRELNLRYNLIFLRQLLHDKNLDLSWADVLVPLAKHAAENIMPNPNVNMDVCHYLQIKKVSDRSRNESHVVNGVVCTKNVVHKSMRTDITDPSILLLAIPLEYQRAQLKLAALDPIVRQEREYYKHLISRIGSRKPKVVIVQYTVSHIAQELLLQAGITLVINVKPSVMERIARSTEADIVYSIDQLLLARLGHCARFYIKHHFIPTPSSSNSSLPNASKTLMYFDGCSPMFGCSIILRNLCDTVTSEELANVKEVLRFIVRAVFHTRLELSYLIDQHGFGSLLKKISSGKRHGSDMVDANKLPTNSTSSSTNVSSTSDRNSPDLKLETLANDTITPIPESPDESLMFKNNIKTLLLSISPLIQPELPFLLTPIGGDPTILKFLPEKLLWSRAFKVQSIDYRQKFLSALDAEQRNVLPKASRSSESSMHNKMFFTAPRQPYDSNSMELLENSTHVDSIENSYKERPDDHPRMLVPGSEKSNTHASCYSQQYYTHSGEGQRNVSEAANAKLNVWEQKLIDVIFGPPVPAKVPKKDKFVLSPDYSPVLAPPPQNKKKTCSKLSVPAFNTTMISSEEDDMDVALIRNSKNVHNFVNCCLNEPVTSNSVKDLIADFRAHAGGTSYPTIDVALSSASMVKEVKQSSPKCAKDEAVSILSRELSNLNGRYPVDCLDPVNHQRISALFSSYSPQSPNAPYFCVLPWVVNIDFYRGNDITLGGFLERYCFRPSYHCPNPACMRTMVEHVRRFVHGNMCMSVVLKELSKPFNQSSILTWSWNHRTKQSSDIRTMSHDAWSMSFAKYLELHLEQLKVPDCGYDSQKQEGLTKQDFSVDDWELRPFNSFQYFLFRDIVASFKCYEIDIKEVVFPDSKLLNYNSELTPSSCQILTDYDDNAVTYHDYHDITDTIAEKFSEAVESILDCIQTAQSRKNANENTEDTSATRDIFYNDFVAALSEENRIIQEQLDDVKQLLTSGDCSVSSVFQTGLQDEMAPIFETLPPQLAKEASNVLFKIKCEISKMVENWNDKLAEAHEMERSGIWSSAKTKNDSSPRPLRRQVLDPRPKLIDDSLHAGNSSTSDSPTLGTLPEDQDYIASVYSSSSSYEHPTNAQDAKTSLKLKKSSAADSKLERSVSYKRFSRGSSVKLLVNRLLPGNVLVPMVPMPFPADEHFLLPECISTGIVVRDAEPTSIIAYALSSDSYKMAAAALASDMCEESLSEAKQKLGQIEDEDKSTPIRDAKNIKTTASPPEITADHMNDAGVVDLTDSPVVSFSSSSSSTPPTSPHIETQFSDSTTRFYCNVYFAKMFENLRAKILGGGENQYLTSLSRSVKWLARGGKSGSTFHKTRDDQFILKQMSHFELQSFMQFAPKYVDYVTRCIQSQQATAISKILGAYRISINNSETGRSWKQDVLVIENLFYRKRVGQIFDLKGSVRNRHVKTTQGKEASDVSGDVDHDDIVFQDENLLKMMCDNPIYVHEHTKHLLMSAISRDAEFLSHNWIMDYSLLVGVDGNNRLVVGIIDFIHKFTWNKKIEMVVKWSSSRSMPTVVSPELYKNRFCEAMGRYFQIVPDRWYGMSMY